MATVLKALRYMIVRQLIVILALAVSIDLMGAETDPVEKVGVRSLQLVTDVNSIQAGQPFTAGLVIRHLPGYHTYWKAPGIVGVATSIAWDLPDGFEVSPMIWPVPELVDMAGYTAYGYQRDVCLLTVISVPDELVGDEVVLKGRVSYMCCSETCHPSWHDFSLTLPVNRAEEPDVDRKWSGVFEKTREEQPVGSPDSWSIEATDQGGKILVTVTSGEGRFAAVEEAYFFAENGMVHSDEPQEVKRTDDRKRLDFNLVRSDFGPGDVDEFSALIFHPKGWPGVDSTWVRVETRLEASDGQTDQ